MRIAFLPLGLFCLSLLSFADDQLLQREEVKKALAYIETNHERTLASQVTIAELPAPTFHEDVRAKVHGFRVPASGPRERRNR
jgi:hypothetical protein